MKKVQELRKLVNKKLPERLKLETGCEFIPHNKTAHLSCCRKYTILEECKDRRVADLKDAPYYYVDEFHYSKNRQQLINKVLIKEILGKPVSLQEILLLIHTNIKNDDISYSDGYDAIMGLCYRDERTSLDLTKEIEDQNNDVLQSLIDLIK